MYVRYTYVVHTSRYTFRKCSKCMPPISCREFLRESLYKNMGIIAIHHSKMDLSAPLRIFPILLSEIHSSCVWKIYLYVLVKLPN